jgi:stage IV sporulation protein FB
MDGGRVFRAVLALWHGQAAGTAIAARVGQNLAFVLGFLGLLGSPMLLFIAIFVYIAAGSEAQATGLQDVSRWIGVRDAMITRSETLLPGATIADAVECLLRTTQHDFPIVERSGQSRRVLTRNALIAALSRTGPTTRVLDVMQRDVPLVPLQGRPEAALRYLQEGRQPVVAVVDGAGRLMGYVTAENAGEMMMVRSARRDPSPDRSGPLLPQ